MTKYYKIQSYNLFALSRDTKKSTYVFLVIFLHLMPGVICGNKYIYIVSRTIKKTNT